MGTDCMYCISVDPRTKKHDCHSYITPTPLLHRKETSSKNAVLISPINSPNPEVEKNLQGYTGEKSMSLN